MGINNAKSRETIKNRLAEGVMTFSIYDGVGRLLSLYEAAWNAKAEDPCLLTEFKYIDAGSRDVLATREAVVEWDSAWDFDSLP